MGSMSAPHGIQSFLKDGAKHMAGLEDAVYKNIEACKQFSTILRTSLGPNGMNKMVLNHLGKLFVTSDANTIVKELEVMHPAAKLLVHASSMQQEEMGDSTNFTVILAGELLQLAEELLRQGLHCSEVAEGYEKAGARAIEILESLEAWKLDDFRDEDKVTKAIRTTIASKQYGLEERISRLVAKACIQACPKNPANFNVDNVRVAKVMGAGLSSSQIVQGMAIPRTTEGTIKYVKDAKVAIFSGGIDVPETETKGTILIENAQQLKDYAKSEEEAMEKVIKEIADTGVKCVVSGAAVGEMALHFCERYKLMVIRTPSKFELRRICRAVNATALVRLGAPTPEEMGFADEIAVEEVGETIVTSIRQKDATIATIILRGGTQNFVDDIERSIDDGVNTYKTLTQGNGMCAGAGANDMEISRLLGELGDATPGLEQYAIKKYAQAMEVVPRTLAENAGKDPADLIASILAAHAKGQKNVGVDIETGTTMDAMEKGVFDVIKSKANAIRLANEAAVTVLRVDQIIMAKQAGGPKGPGPNPHDDIPR